MPAMLFALWNFINSQSCFSVFSELWIQIKLLEIILTFYHFSLGYLSDFAIDNLKSSNFSTKSRQLYLYSYICSSI